MKDSNYDFFSSFLGNNDAKPNNVESAGEGLVAGTSGMSSDPYEASVSAALSSMNINSEAASQGNLLRGIDNFLGAARSVVQDHNRSKFFIMSTEFDKNISD